MRIGFHLQALHPGEIGGLEVYVRALVQALPALDPEVELVLVGTAENLPTFPDSERVEKVELQAQDFARLDREGIARWQLDLWFCPLLTLEPSEPGIPCVVTIPDLQHESYPEFFSPDILAWRHLHYRRSVARADRVLTLSQHARRQLVDRLAADPERLVAIPLDAHPDLSPESTCDRVYLEAIRDRYDLAEKYFFYPGNRWPHKNHEALFRAFARLRQSRPEVELVLTGSKVGRGETSEQPGLERGVRSLGYVPNGDLAGLYALSLGLVFPSLFEGFGIPLVEAMRVGCPVTASSSTSLPEVGGDAVLYFDPRNPEEIASRLEQLCDDGPLRDELVAAGRRQARRFSWTETARATLEVFREVVGSETSALRPIAKLPSISVIVPSFQQAAFLPKTLDSLLAQGHPDLQVIVVDGGSTDGSVGILERYRAEHPEQIEFESEPDRGQAHAVNKGLARARGEIIGWLNSDDLLTPFALLEVVREFMARPECKILYGRADYIDTEGAVIGTYPVREVFDWWILAHQCFLCQPAVFWRRELVEQGFHLNEDLQVSMDYDLWIRMGKEVPFQFSDRVLAQSRLYPENKTLGRRSEVFDEILQVVYHHYGWIPFSWALGRASHRLASERGDLDQRPEWRAILLAVATFVRRNRHRPDLWPSLWRELRNAASKDNRAQVRGTRLRIPTSWSGVLFSAKVIESRQGQIRVCDARTGRVLGRIALDELGSIEKVIGMPRASGRGSHFLRLEGESRALEDVRVAPYELLPKDRRLPRSGRLILPASWRSAEMSIEPGEDLAGRWRLVFLLNRRPIVQWILSKPGACRRWLPLPESGKELDLVLEPIDGHAELAPHPLVRLIEMQEGMP